VRYFISAAVWGVLWNAPKRSPAISVAPEYCELIEGKGKKL
jgi:hypothetical protein